MLSDSEHKMSVVVLFGGMSSEHEVSRVSAGTFVDQLGVRTALCRACWSWPASPT